MPLIVARPEHNDYAATKLATSYYRAQAWLECGEWSLAARAVRDVAQVWNRLHAMDRADLQSAGWSFLPTGMDDRTLAAWIVAYERSKDDAYHRSR